MDGAIVLIWCVVGISGLLFLYKVGVELCHFLLVHFGVETTTLVLHSERYDEDGATYLQGYYEFKDARGHNYSFDFRICSYWPIDEQWQEVIQLYTEGAQNCVRYLHWLPTIHEVQASSINKQGSIERGTCVMRLSESYSERSPSMKLR